MGCLTDRCKRSCLTSSVERRKTPLSSARLASKRREGWSVRSFAGGFSVSNCYDFKGRPHSSRRIAQALASSRAFSDLFVRLAPLAVQERWFSFQFVDAAIHAAHSVHGVQWYFV